MHSKLSSILVAFCAASMLAQVGRAQDAQAVRANEPAPSQEATTDDGLGERPAKELDPKIFARSEKDLDAEIASSTIVPEELRDEAFDRFIEMQDILRAYYDADVPRLTDGTLTLLNAEQVLRRKHHSGVVGAELLAIAGRMAATRGDSANVARLTAAARNLGDNQVVKELQAISKLAAESRSASIELGGFTHLLDWIEEGQLTGNKNLLDGLEKSLPAQLGPDQKEFLVNRLKTAKETAAEARPPSNSLAILQKLGSPSRSGAALLSFSVKPDPVLGNHECSFSFLMSGGGMSSPLVNITGAGRNIPDQSIRPKYVGTSRRGVTYRATVMAGDWPYSGDAFDITATSGGGTKTITAGFRAKNPQLGSITVTPADRTANGRLAAGENIVITINTFENRSTVGYFDFDLEYRCTQRINSSGQVVRDTSGWRSFNLSWPHNRFGRHHSSKTLPSLALTSTAAGTITFRATAGLLEDGSIEDLGEVSVSYPLGTR